MYNTASFYRNEKKIYLLAKKKKKCVGFLQVFYFFGTFK